MFNLFQRNTLGDDPKNRVILACHGTGVSSAAVAGRFDAATRLLSAGDVEPVERRECLHKLADIFITFIESRNWTVLKDITFDRGLTAAERLLRLDMGVAISELVAFPRVSAHEEMLRREIALSSIRELFEDPRTPTDTALKEMHLFIKGAPAFMERLVQCERSRSDSLSQDDLTRSDRRFLYRTEEVVAANLMLLMEKNMPASIVMKVTESLIIIDKHSLRDEIIDMWKWFAHSSMCSSASDDRRLPEPIGRAAFVGAIKANSSTKRRGEADWGPNNAHQLPASLPTNPATWKYFAQRLTSLAGIKDPLTRNSRIAAYVISFREFVAAHPFYEREEEFFRQANLKGVSSEKMRTFYREEYGVDNGPGPDGSQLAEVPRKEAAKAFRVMAAARYGLNVRKGYARTLESGKWLLEHMAEELAAESDRYRVADIEGYPGPGVRMSGLDIRNALDLSTSESCRRHLKASPWIGASMRAGKDVEYHLFRGFKGISRTLDSALSPTPPVWQEKASFDGEVYSALIFNDHFHNDLLPEARMWLVPERVLHRKLVFAIENGVDVNRLDVTPEGIAEEAEALDLVIFDVGTSCVRWGSFANAWPHATGPAHEWERYSEWAYSRWQSPRHIHRALRTEDYHSHLTPEVGRTMAAARVEHDSIKHMVHFFLDLHSSFLTMEEAWAKGYANAEEEPAREEAPPQSSAAEEKAEPSEPQENANDNLSDMLPRRPRTRMLRHFLEMRNQIVSSKRDLTAQDFPSLELQYTRIFARQENIPYISGHDMTMVFPDGKRMSLLQGKAQPGTIIRKAIRIDERIEALWDQYMVSQFAPNNCPRIVLP